MNTHFPAHGPGTKWCLGRCVFRNDRFTRLEPLLIAEADGWNGVANRKRMFPDVGNVFAVERPAVGAEEGSLWVFRCGENTRTTGVDQPDRFLAVDIREPIEILDFSSSGPEAARRAIVELGVDPVLFPTSEVVVVVGPNSAVRLRLKQGYHDGKWRPENVDALDALNVYPYDASFHAGVAVSGRRFLLPDAPLGVPTGIVDWTSDIDFLSKVLNKIRRSSSTQHDVDRELTKRTIERLMAAFRDSEMLATDPKSNQAMLERLRVLAPSLKANRAAITEIGAVLLEMPSIEEQIRAAVDQARNTALGGLRSELRPIVQAEIEHEEHEARGRLLELEAQIAAAKSATSGLAQEIAELSSERELQRSGLAEDVEKLLQTFGRTAEAARHVSELLERYGLGTTSSKTADDAGDAPWAVAEASGADPIDIGELFAELSKREQGKGLPKGALAELDVVARAGEIALLLGDETERLITEYGACVAGGSPWRMSLDPTVIGLDDLWRQPGTGVPTSFARAWNHASSNPDRTVLVVLDDLDAALGCLWLPRLAEHLRSPARPANLLVLATLVPDATTGGPSRDILSALLPLAWEGGATGAIAAVRRRDDTVPATWLVHASVAPASPEAKKLCLAEIGGLPGIRSTTAIRAFAIYEVASATLGGEAALAIASSVAAQLSGATSEAAATALGRGFAHLGRRFRSNH